MHGETIKKDIIGFNVSTTECTRVIWKLLYCIQHLVWSPTENKTACNARFCEKK